MIAGQLDTIRAWFYRYVDGFSEPAGSLSPFLVLKLEHSQRVANDARDMAEDLCWDGEAVRKAEALGWLHDVGRFSQFAEFGHFHDATSIDHGQRGFEVVRDAGILEGLPEKDSCCLLQGIRHHNAKAIPSNLPADCLPLVRLLRDADKLDIYLVVADALEKDGFRELCQLWPHVELEGPTNPLMLRDIRTRRSGSTANVQSLADFLLLQASWVYDLHYDPAFERVRRRGILDTIARHLPDEHETQEVMALMQAHLSERNAAGDGIASPCPDRTHSGWNRQPASGRMDET